MAKRSTSLSVPKEMQERFDEITRLTGAFGQERLNEEYQLDPDWTLPSKIEQNPMAWMIQVNGLIVDARHMPYHIQVDAFLKGLIPYIPDK